MLSPSMGTGFLVKWKRFHGSNIWLCVTLSSTSLISAFRVSFPFFLLSTFHLSLFLSVPLISSLIWRTFYRICHLCLISFSLWVHRSSICFKKLTCTSGLSFPFVFLSIMNPMGMNNEVWQQIITLNANWRLFFIFFVATEFLSSLFRCR